MPFFKHSILIGWNQSSIFHLEFIQNFSLLNLKFKWGEVNLTRNNKVAKRIVSDIFQNHKKFSLILKGTSFSNTSMEQTFKFKYSKINFYSELSIEIFGNTKYSRAIGSTLAKNSIAYLIPCHLVCSKNNKTMNYKWGADLKRKLIDHDFETKNKYGNNSNLITL